MANDWNTDALCAEVGPAIFMPTVYQDRTVAAAKSICRRCEAETDCLNAALAEEEGQDHQFRATIRGGLTPRERWAYDREQQEAAA